MSNTGVCRHSADRSSASQRGRWFSVSTLAFAAVIGGACEDRGKLTETRAPGAVQLLLSANIGAEGRKVDVDVFYSRENRSRVALLSKQFDVDTGARSLMVGEVDVTACFADGDRLGGTGCPLGAKVTLRDSVEGIVDSTVVGMNVGKSAADSVVSLPAVTLTRTAAVRLAVDSARLHAGDTLTVAASALDPAGRAISGRTLSWTSADPTIATVTPSGLVRGVRVGRTVLSAKREGVSASMPLTVPITGVTQWVDGGRLGTIGAGSQLIWPTLSVVAIPGGSPTAITSDYQRCGHDGTSWSCSAIPSPTGFGGVRKVSILSPTNIWGAGYGAVSAINASGFQNFATGFNNSYYLDVWASSPHIVAVGYSFDGTGALFGIVSQFDGARWSNITLPAGATVMRGVWGSSPTNVFVVGDSSNVMRYDGRQWTRTHIGGPVPTCPLYNIWGADSSNVFVGGACSQAWRFDGRQWLSIPGPFWEINALHGVSATEVYAAAAVDSQHVLLNWNGLRWTKLANLPHQVTHLYAVGDGRIYFGGPEGFVGLYRNGIVSTLSFTPMLGVPAVASASYAVVAGGNQMFRFDGLTWSPLPTPWPAPFIGHIQSLWASGPSDVFATASARPFSYLTRFNGTSWQRLAGGDANYLAIAGLRPNDVLVLKARWDGVTYYSSILRCSSGGCSTAMPEVSGMYAVNMWATSATNVFLAGWTFQPGTGFSQYMTARWDGRTLQRRDISTNQYFPNRVWALDSSNVFLATSSGVKRYDYARNDWLALPGETTYANGVWGTAFDDLYTTRCSIARYNGRSWRAATMPDNRCSIAIAGLPEGGAIATVIGAQVLRGIGPTGAFSVPGGASLRESAGYPTMARSLTRAPILAEDEATHLSLGDPRRAPPPRPPRPPLR